MYYIMLFTTLLFIMSINFWIFDHFKTHECMFIKEEQTQTEITQRLLKEEQNTDTQQETQQTTDTEPPVPDSGDNTTQSNNTSNVEDPSPPPSDPTTTETANSPSTDSSINAEQLLATLKQATQNILIICPVIMGLVYLISFLTTLLYCYAFCHFKGLYNKNPHNLSSPGFFAKARGFFLKLVPPLNRLLHFVVFLLIICQTFIFYFHSGCQHVRTKNVFGEYESSKLNELRLYLLLVFLGFWIILEFIFAGWRVSITQLHFHYRPFQKNTGRFKRFISNLGYY
jgi:hypothetical protein